MLVRDFMTADPVTISPKATHMEAVKIMRTHGFRRLPVVDKQGQLVGIVAEKDLLSTQPSPATSLSIWEIHSLLSKLKVKDFMSHPVITVGQGCAIEDAAQIMVDNKVGSLPVMDGTALVGIITETDLFKAMTQMMAGGDRSARLTVRLQRQSGVIAALAAAITQTGGLIASLSTLNEADGEHKRIAVKVNNVKESNLSEAIAAHADWEVLDIRQSGECQQSRLFGKE